MFWKLPWRRKKPSIDDNGRQEQRVASSQGISQGSSHLGRSEEKFLLVFSGGGGGWWESVAEWVFNQIKGRLEQFIESVNPLRLQCGWFGSERATPSGLQWLRSTDEPEKFNVRFSSNNSVQWDEQTVGNKHNMPGLYLTQGRRIVCFQYTHWPCWDQYGPPGSYWGHQTFKKQKHLSYNSCEEDFFNHWKYRTSAKVAVQERKVCRASRSPTALFSVSICSELVFHLTWSFSNRVSLFVCLTLGCCRVSHLHKPSLSSLERAQPQNPVWSEL